METGGPWPYVSFGDSFVIVWNVRGECVIMGVSQGKDLYLKK